MKTENGRRTLCLLATWVLVLLCASTAQAQFLQQLFNPQSRQVPPTHKVSPEIAQAFRPSESDLEAAKNVRNSLFDAERAAQYSPVDKTEISPEMMEFWESVQHLPRDLRMEKFRELVESPPQPIPCDFDSMPQVCIETRLIECASWAIAPKGMLAEQGWVLLPIAQEQKAPAALRVSDLMSEDNTPPAAGVMNVIEQYAPTLIRFIDTDDFALGLQSVQGDSRSNLLQAPKVTIISGQSGRINDTTTVLYAWNNSKGDDGTAIEGLRDGTTIQYRPEVLEDGSVRMKELHVTFSRTIGTQRYALDPENEVFITVPKLQTRKFNLPVTIPAGKTLLVALPQPFDGGWVTEGPKGTRIHDTPDTFCLAVTCHVFPAEVIAESTQKVEKTTSQPELSDSENLRQTELEWQRVWMPDKPSSLTTSRVNGAIM